MLRLRYYQETGQTEEAAQYQSYLKETGQWKQPNSAAIRARQNANEMDMAEAETPGYLSSALGGVSAIARGIPGMEAVQAGARSVVRGQSYRDALQDIRGSAADNPASTVATMAGAAPLAAMLPGGPVAGGALLGGADQALNADADQSLLERGARTAVGAAGGALLGKGLDLGITAVRAARATDAAKLVADLVKKRAASAKRLYTRAIAEGQGKAPTAEITAFLAKEDIAPIADGLLATRSFAGKDRHSPEVLDGIYKVLSDKQAQIKRGLLQPEPSKANIGRFASEDIGLAQREALTAADGPMPSYRGAVQDYAKRSGDIDAVIKGVEALRATRLSGVPAGKRLAKFPTEEQLAEWAKTATPSQIAHAKQGILSGLKGSRKLDPAALFGTRIIPLPSRQLKATPGLLRALDKDDAGAQLAKYGLLMTNAAAQ
jgi:hypothetical protein